MLAPRKKLWSTPNEVISHVIQTIALHPEDTVCDIGCGDGNVLLRWAEAYSSSYAGEGKGEANQTQMMPTFIGIDIAEERIENAIRELDNYRRQGKILTRINVSFHCANALEASHLFQNANIFFLYLIPRGLRIMRPILEKHLETMESPCRASRSRVITYMAPLEETEPEQVFKVAVPHQPGASWPLYYYRIGRKCTT